MDTATVPALSTAAATGNIVDVVLARTREYPERTALIVPTAWNERSVTTEQRMTFADLGERIASYADGAASAGLQPGDRVFVVAPMSADLFALVLGLSAAGLVVVLIDGALPRRVFVRALREVRAKAVVSTKQLFRYQWLLPPLWRARKYSFDSSGLTVASTSRLRGVPVAGFQPVRRAPGDSALVTFTSGSTGSPKGVDRSHGVMLGQHAALSHLLCGGERDVAMTCFPVVAFHNLAAGLTTVMPAADLRVPAALNPALVLSQLGAHAVTQLSAGPAFLQRLIEGLGSEPLRGVRTLVVGGAPVSRDLARLLLERFPDAEVTVAYGSSEAEPIAHVSAREVAQEAGDGVLVGAPVPGVEVALVELPDEPPRLDARGLAPYAVADGRVGEVVVAGPHVATRYLDNPDADRRRKMRDGARLWHRTGDVGYRDSNGRLWLVGRTTDAVARGDRLLHPLPLEIEVGACPGVRRAALIAHRRAPRGELAVEFVEDADVAASLNQIRRVLAARTLADLPIRRVAHVPTDRRHNSKVDRLQLRHTLERA
ncbi:MAG TPA: AMP-binding protein [Vicinamibacterales bacterium]|nr:AMP-binding protein [Vicinamibacterales bacterium]